MVKLSEVQLKICTYREMHMHFQYIKCWCDRGLINEIRLIKSPDIFVVIYNSSITPRNKIYGSRSENM